MKKSTKFITLILASILGLGALFTVPTYADQINCSDNDIPQSVRDAAGCEGTTDQLPSVIINIINAIIGIAGIIAVIFIILGGVSYMTSTGDPGKIKKAKDTILYAVIGLAICILAFVIVNFAISTVNNSSSTSSSSSSESTPTRTKK